MEKSKKQLKISSILVLIFAAVMVVGAVSDIFFTDMTQKALATGALEDNLLLAKIIVGAVTLVLALAYLYVGLKGLKVAKNPDASNGHIRCAKVLFVLSVLSLISPIVAIIKQNHVSDNIAAASTLLVEIVIFFDYVRNAKAVAKGE